MEQKTVLEELKLNNLNIKWDIFDGKYVQLNKISNLISRNLTEPYNIYTYRYFVYQWPELCHMVEIDEQLVGVIIGKIKRSSKCLKGYIGMLVVETNYRRCGIGKQLIERIIHTMNLVKVQEITLETKTTNKSAINLYLKLGFIKYKYIPRYYSNRFDALKLKYYS